jgi:hypothetical protein
MVHDPSWIKPAEFQECFGDSTHSRVTTVGWPVFEDERCLVVAQQMGADGTVADCMRILKAGILGIWHTDGKPVVWVRERDIFRYEQHQAK